METVKLLTKEAKLLEAKIACLNIANQYSGNIKAVENNYKILSELLNLS